MPTMSKTRSQRHSAIDFCHSKQAASVWMRARMWHKDNALWGCMTCEYVYLYTYVFVCDMFTQIYLYFVSDSKHFVAGRFEGGGVLAVRFSFPNN